MTEAPKPSALSACCEASVRYFPEYCQKYPTWCNKCDKNCPLKKPSPDPKPTISGEEVERLLEELQGYQSSMVQSVGAFVVERVSAGRASFSNALISDFPKLLSYIRSIQAKNEELEGNLKEQCRISAKYQNLYDHQGRKIVELEGKVNAVRSFKAKTFPERESDEFDAGYAQAVSDLHASLPLSK